MRERRWGGRVVLNMVWLIDANGGHIYLTDRTDSLRDEDEQYQDDEHVIREPHFRGKIT